MKSLKINFQHFDADQHFENIDIVCTEKVWQPGRVLGCSLAEIRITDGANTANIRIKFEWIFDREEIREEDFCFVESTGMLFFRSINQFGIIDVVNKCLKEHKEAHWCPFISKYNTFVLVEDDLSAKSFTLQGKLIDEVPLDPPYEMQEFEDRLEYTCDIHGHQVLKTR